MLANLDYRPVLAAYGRDCQPSEVEFLGNAGGFSGAQLWRLQTPRGVLGLRRWPREYPSHDQLQFIQAVLWHVDQERFHLVPVPLETRTHAGYVEHAGHLWELVPWIPGKADYETAPSPSKLRAAMIALAEFHHAAESFPLPDLRRSISPGIQHRLNRVRELMNGGLVRLAQRIDSRDWPQLAARAHRCVELFPLVASDVETTLAQATLLRVPLQPCIRDIWHDHLLFEGQRVSGLIDFGALQPESVAADVARLLGSLVADDPDGWLAGIASYEEVRPLSPAEAVLVSAFDRGNVLLSAFNWFLWYYEEERHFENRAGVLARLDHHLDRLANLAVRE